MKNAAIVVAIVAILVVLGGGAVLISKNTGRKSSPTSSSNQSSSTTQSNSSSSNSSEQNPATTITYSDNGFSPKTLTVSAGTAVTIKNASSGPMEFDSDPHPEHTDDPELNVGIVEPGGSMTFTLTVKGTHGYHNHLDASMTGTLIVR